MSIENISMTYSQYSHHDTKQCLLSDKQQAELIEQWQQSKIFE